MIRLLKCTLYITTWFWVLRILLFQFHMFMKLMTRIVSHETVDWGDSTKMWGRSNYWWPDTRSEQVSRGYHLNVCRYRRSRLPTETPWLKHSRTRLPERYLLRPKNQRQATTPITLYVVIRYGSVNINVHLLLRSVSIYETLCEWNVCSPSTVPSPGEKTNYRTSSSIKGTVI